MSWGVMGWGMVEDGWRKGPWTAEEDKLLIEYVRIHGEGRWNSVARLAGLKRNGKSCRLRWVNYLRPDLKRGQITPHEESIILELHARWGNRWSTIARSLPGRTDNEIKNYWRTHFKKKTKPSSDTLEKTKNRLLRRKQFRQQQQQQQLFHEQKQQLLRFNQLDMKKIMSLLEDDQDDDTNKAVPFGPQTRHEMATAMAAANSVWPGGAEDQWQGYYGQYGNGYMPGDANEDDIMIWDELWNLDEAHGSFAAANCAANKACFQNLITPFVS